MKIKLITLITISLLMCSVSTTRPLSSEKAVKPDRKYTFSADWFTKHIPNWTRVLSDMKGKPNLTYL